MTSQIFLRKNIHNRISYFHPWIYANEIGAAEGEMSPGKVVEVFSHLGSFVGQGFYNPYASVQVKMFAFQNRVQLNEEYLRALIMKAWTYRKAMGYKDAFRLFNAEGDQMPGLIIDHYPYLIVFQTQSLGIDYLKTELIKVLKSIFPTYAIYEQNEVFVRNLEGLRLQRKWHSIPKENQQFEFKRESLILSVFPETHDRTGFDWENEQIWKCIQPFIKNNFLNLFSGLGILNILAEGRGVENNWAVDYNPQFLQSGKEMADRNNLQDIEWIHANVFDFLKSKTFLQHQWDVIVINPPSFIHKKEQLLKAFNAYKELLIRVLPQLKKGGVLLVSFPHYLYQESWVTEVMQSCMRDSKVEVRQLQMVNARWDHPAPASFLQNKGFQAYVWQVN